MPQKHVVLFAIMPVRLFTYVTDWLSATVSAGHMDTGEALVSVCMLT